MTLGSQLIGTWRLVSREDRTLDGQPRVDPILGPDPIAVLIYDRGGTFAAQFMKRDRSTVMPAAAPVTGNNSSAVTGNNSSAINGYDAYFGSYTVDETSGTVTQTLLGALSAGDVGKVVTREMRVVDDTLTLQLQTTNAAGEPVVRTLRWIRAG